MIVSTIFSAAFSKRVLGIGALAVLVSAPLQADSIKAVLQVPETEVITTPYAQLADVSVQTDVAFVKPSERLMDEDMIKALELRLKTQQNLEPGDQARIDAPANAAAIARGIATR